MGSGLLMDKMYDEIGEGFAALESSCLLDKKN
jgi:hypothetical protein